MRPTSRAYHNGKWFTVPADSAKPRLMWMLYSSRYSVFVRGHNDRALRIESIDAPAVPVRTHTDGRVDIEKTGLGRKK